MVLAGACLKIPPKNNRETYRLAVTNDYPYPMNVTVQHNGGLLLLGVVPPGESREFPLRLWYAQPVSVVATPLDDFLRLRRTVTVAQHCVAHILLQQDVQIGQPVVVPTDRQRDTAVVRPDKRERADSSTQSRSCTTS
jgi:hypothetical protein